MKNSLAFCLSLRNLWRGFTGIPACRTGRHHFGTRISTWIVLVALLPGADFLAATPTAGQAVVVGVYTDILRPLGMAYDPANDLIWYTTQANSLVHSLVPFKTFSPAQIASFPTVNGVPEIPAALAQNSAFITDPVAVGGAPPSGKALAYDEVVAQLVSATSMGGVLQSYTPITAAGLNPNYRPGTNPLSNPVDGLDIDGGTVWLSYDVNSTYKDGALFSDRTNTAHTTLPSWSGSGGAVGMGWSGVEQVSNSLYAVAVQTFTDSPTSRTLVRFDANTGILVGFDPDGFGVGVASPSPPHLEDLAFDGRFFYVADVFGDANGSGAIGDIYVFQVTGGLEYPATDCSITIIKETSPAGGTGFSFGSAFFPGFTLNDGQSRSFSGPHLCGPIYNLYEIPQPNWALTNIACVFTSGSGSFDIIGATVSPTSGFEPGDNEVVFHSLEPGSGLECTFTNSGCVPPPHGMRAWWPLDETSPSTSKDIRGFNNKGTWMGNPVPGTGMVAGGLCFNGSNFVEVLDHAELDFGDGDLSIDAWIYPENASGIEPIVDKRENNAEAHGYTLFLGNGILAFQLAVDSRSITSCGPTLNNDCQNYSSGVSILPNRWTHVAVTVDRDDPNGGVFYVDGVEILPHFNPTTQMGSISNSGNLWIGRRVPVPVASSDRYFHGCIDEVELFDRVLSPTEVQSIFDAGSAGKCKTTSGAIPTLTEWGMIIFCALLFAWMAWVLVRRSENTATWG